MEEVPSCDPLQNVHQLMVGHEVAQRAFDGQEVTASPPQVLVHLTALPGAKPLHQPLCQVSPSLQTREGPGQGQLQQSPMSHTAGQVLA